MRRCKECEQLVGIVRGRVVRLRKLGYTYRRIGSMLDISPSLAWYYVHGR